MCAVIVILKGFEKNKFDSTYNFYFYIFNPIIYYVSLMHINFGECQFPPGFRSSVWW